MFDPQTMPGDPTMHWLDEVAEDDYELPDLDTHRVLALVLDGVWGIAADDMDTYMATLRRIELTTDRELHLFMQVDRWVIRSCGPNPRAYRYPSRDQFLAEAWRRHETLLATPVVPAVATLLENVQWTVAARSAAVTYLTSYLRGIGQVGQDDMITTGERWVRTISADALAGIT